MLQKRSINAKDGNFFLLQTCKLPSGKFRSFVYSKHSFMSLHSLGTSCSFLLGRAVGGGKQDFAENKQGIELDLPKAVQTPGRASGPCGWSTNQDPGLLSPPALGHPALCKHPPMIWHETHPQVPPPRSSTHTHTQAHCREGTYRVPLGLGATSLLPIQEPA